MSLFKKGKEEHKAYYLNKYPYFFFTLIKTNFRRALKTLTNYLFYFLMALSECKCHY